MPIQILQEGMRMGPVAVCDHCGKRIENGALTIGGDNPMYAWRFETKRAGEMPPIYFVHGYCFDPFTKGDKHSEWYTENLECLLPFLAHNLKLDWNDAKSAADFSDSLG